MLTTQYLQKYLFRILHIDNLEHILSRGMFAPNAMLDEEYVNIGDEALIFQRSELHVPIAPWGVLSDYVPFYFGGHSPMLLNIKTGYRGIKKREQREIVYLCTHIETIINAGLEYCFTDGHAKNRLTVYFNNVLDLGHVDWATVSSKYWNNTEDDPDRMRRKQAEFLVKSHVPETCFTGIIVSERETENIVKTIQQKTDNHLPVYIDHNRKYYYDD